MTLKNESTKVVDGLGHYIFDLDLFDVYGEIPEQNTVNGLKLKFK